MKEWDISINYGIKTGLNEAFIIDKPTRDRLIVKDYKNDEIINTLLRGRDIKKYSVNFVDLYLINVHNGKAREGAIKINDYPSIKKWLDTFEPKLSKITDKGVTAYNLRNCSYLSDFEKEKIVYTEIVREAKFYFDNDNVYIEATDFIMIGYRLKYLLANLNSKLMEYSFKKFYAGGGLGENRCRYI